VPRALKDRRASPSRRLRAADCPVGDDPAAAPSFFAGVRGPLRRVLERLDAEPQTTTRAWRGLLRRLNPSRDDYNGLATLDLPACYRHLLFAEQAGLAKGDAAYCLAVERAAKALIRQGVPEDQAIAAVGLFLEACLSRAKGPIETRALVRLTSATQRLISAGYGEARATGLSRLDDRERQKLSADLHDEVGADLVVLKLYVEMISLELAQGSVNLIAPKLQEALVLIAHSIEAIRRLTLDLGPASLESLGFLPALRSVVRQFSKRTGIKVELLEPTTRLNLPPSYEAAVYRVLLGALSNVAKHSKARHVTVALKGGGNVFLMTVLDDGRGFDVTGHDPDRSFGLTAMNERIRSLHGRLRIESRIASRRGDVSGTRIEVRLPMRKTVEP